MTIETVVAPEHSHVHLAPGRDIDENNHFIDPRTIRFPNDDLVASEAVTLEQMRRMGRA